MSVGHRHNTKFIEVPLQSEQFTGITVTSWPCHFLGHICAADAQFKRNLLQNLEMNEISETESHARALLLRFDEELGELVHLQLSFLSGVRTGKEAGLLRV